MSFLDKETDAKSLKNMPLYQYKSVTIILKRGEYLK